MSLAYFLRALDAALPGLELHSTSQYSGWGKEEVDPTYALTSPVEEITGQEGLSWR